MCFATISWYVTFHEAGVCTEQPFYIIQVGTLNRTGKRYKGHFNIWITNAIQKYVIVLKERLNNPPDMTQWVNTDFYQKTSEVIGVLPIPTEVQDRSQMRKYSPPARFSVDGEGRTIRINPPRYDNLAKLQKVKKAVLPVHTPYEHQLFRQLTQTHPDFMPTPRGEPNWDKAATVWNELALIHKDAYYKVSCSIYI